MHDQIDKLVKENPVVLFMKGSPQLPQCGYSQRVAAILSEYGIPLITVNVLLDPAVREEIKTYSNWPTIPQLYVQGEFIGGCDIVSEMHANGELSSLLEGLRE